MTILRLFSYVIPIPEPKPKAPSTVNTNPAQNLITSNKYMVRFASSEEEMHAAQHLRFTVFNLELGEGLERSYETERDEDKYDPHCHHLLVIERQSEEVIGTYRLQTYKKAKRKHGFYTAREYDLDSLPQELLEDSVEVGRACIHKDHRNGRVLYLLWRGIAEFLSQTDSRYLLGCCSITSQDPRDGWRVMDYLVQNDLTHPDIRVPAQPEYRCEDAERGEEDWKSVQLPQLFRLYMDVGARVCSTPALDSEFKTIDYLVVLNVDTLDERTRMLFFK